MELRTHDPADRITKDRRGRLRQARTAGAVGTGFLAKVLPDKDMREYLQRVIGVALLGKVARAQPRHPHRRRRQRQRHAVSGGCCFAFGDYADMAHPELFMSHRNPDRPRRHPPIWHYVGFGWSSSRSHAGTSRSTRPGSSGSPEGTSSRRGACTRTR